MDGLEYEEFGDFFSFRDSCGKLHVLTRCTASCFRMYKSRIADRLSHLYDFLSADMMLTVYFCGENLVGVVVGSSPRKVYYLDFLYFRDVLEIKVSEE